MLFHAFLAAPCKYGIACEIGAIIADDHRQPAELCAKQQGSRRSLKVFSSKATAPSDSSTL